MKSLFTHLRAVLAFCSVSALCLHPAFNNKICAQNLEWAHHAPRSINPLGGDVTGIGIKTDREGNLYTVGTFTQIADMDTGPGSVNLSSQGEQDIYVAKYNANGVYRWAFSIGGKGSERIERFTTDPDGNVYVSGQFSLSVDFDPGPGERILHSAGDLDIFVAKYDANGRYVWAFSIGGAGTDRTACIKTDEGGNVYIAGSFYQTIDLDPDPAAQRSFTSQGSGDLFLAKYSPQGAFLNGFALGGIGYDVIHEIAIDAGGQLYVAGAFEGVVNFDPGLGLAPLSAVGGHDGFIAKYSPQFEFSWAYRIGGAGTDYATHILSDGLGNLYVSGLYTDGNIDFDVKGGSGQRLGNAGNRETYIAKYSSDGSFRWARRLAGTSSGENVAHRMELDSRKANLYVAGRFQASVGPAGGAVTLVSRGGNDGYITRYDSAGNFVWITQAGGLGNDEYVGICLDRSDRITATGYFNATARFGAGAAAQDLSSLNKQNAFIARYDTTGALTWLNQLGVHQSGSTDVRNRRITRDAAGNLYIAGHFSGSADFDPGPGLVVLNSRGLKDAFLAKYTHDGLFLWVQQMGGPGEDIATGVSTDVQGDVYVIGDFSAGAVFASNAPLQTSTGATDVFVAKYASAGDLRWVKSIGAISYLPSAISVYGESVYITGGTASRLIDFGCGSTTSHNGIVDFYIASYNSTTGACNKVIRRGGAGFHACTRGLLHDADGNLYVSGFFSGTMDFGESKTRTSSGEADAFSARYGPDLQCHWVTTFGGPTDDDALGDIALDEMGHLYTTGYFRPGANFGSVSLPNRGEEDVFLAKLNAASGALAQVAPLGGKLLDVGFDVLFHDGHIYLCGFFRDTAYFDPNSSINGRLISQGASDVFLAKYNTSLNHIWSFSLGGTADDAAYSLAAGPNGSVYLAGEFAQRVSLDFWGIGQKNLLSENGLDGFLLKFGSFGVGIDEMLPQDDGMPVLFPNPSSGKLWLRATQAGKAQLQLFDITGRSCWCQEMLLSTGLPHEISPQSLPPGVYAWTLHIAGRAYSGRVVLQ